MNIILGVLGIAFSYFMAIAFIELYGRYLLRRDAKRRERLLLGKEYYE